MSDDIGLMFKLVAEIRVKALIDRLRAERDEARTRVEELERLNTT